MSQIDPRLLTAARRSVNFGVLEQIEPLLALYGAGAEATAYDDPNGALVKCRQFGEVLVEQLLRRSSTRVMSSRQVDRIRALEDAGVLTERTADALHQVRKAGNDATHSHLFNVRVTVDALARCFELGMLLHRAVSGDRSVRTFVPPQPPAQAASASNEDRREIALLDDQYRASEAELAEALTVLDAATSARDAEATARLKAEEELARARTVQQDTAAMLAELQSKLAELTDAHIATPPEPVTPAARAAFIERARRPRPLSEVEARRVIDAQLRAAGWLVQDYADAAPTAGQGVAVREFRLATGFADYVLYVDAKIVGVIEAKKEGISLTEVEGQSRRYAEGLPKDARLAAWRRDEPLAFRYESTGAETRFTNRLEPDATSREVFTFHRPRTLADAMARADADRDAPTLIHKIRALPDLDRTALRPNQIDAVLGIEQSLGRRRPRALVQMATGAGKTFTAVTATYRLVAHAGASRVLFLVDRNNLGEQAEGEFDNYTAPDDGRRFGDLYNVQRLAGRRVNDSTTVAISTIQRLFRMLSGEDVPDADAEADAEDAPYEPATPVDVVYNAAMPPETFDLIIVDECHRSIYGKWRAVLEYFDAPVVGLTATPTKQTLGFFDQNIVSEYSYEHSVADGVNVPFSVYRIRTRITEDGASIEAGTIVPVRDRKTRAKRYQELEDDYTYAGTQIGRSVIAEDQIRTVLETFRDRLFTEIFPNREAVPKTLIFAKDDNHADIIVQRVREAFGKGQDFAAKITYRSKSQGNDPKKLLQEFRNSVSLRVAVTVDMIATGTDVRAIECVFFLREVRSAVYFEQMKGRGARIMAADEYAAVTPDAVGGRTKDHFMIVDAVGVTDSPLVDATPMERLAPSVSLQALLGKAGALTITPDEVSTLLARLDALEHQLTPPQRDELAAVGDGTSLREVVRQLGTAADPDVVLSAREDGGDDAVAKLVRDAVAPLTRNPDLRARILEIRREKDILFDEVNADELLSTEKVDHGREPMDRVASFRDFLRENADELAALQVLHGSDSDRPTYAQLRELAERVSRVPAIGSVNKLWQAYAALGEVTDTRHQAGVTDLVTILRHELAKDSGHDGSRIDSFSSVVEARLETWMTGQRALGVDFSESERWWVRRICDVVKSSVAVELDDLDRTPFSERGGTFGFVRDFGDAARARAVLDELNQELTA